MIAKWTRPKLKNLHPFIFSAPGLTTYFQNYWSHRNGSPINISRIKQGKPLQCYGNDFSSNYCTEIEQKLGVRFFITFFSTECKVRKAN